MLALTEQIRIIADEIQKQSGIYHAAVIMDEPLAIRIELARKIRSLQAELALLVDQLKDEV